LDLVRNVLRTLASVTATEAGGQSFANASPDLPAPAASATLARGGILASFGGKNRRRWEGGGGQGTLKRKLRGNPAEFGT
jgi:hypothetical protein